MLKLLISAFRTNGYKGYKSPEAQKKFADSLLKIADKAFWAPIAYYGVVLYQDRPIENSGIMFLVLFICFGVSIRHQALVIYDQHYEKEQKRKQKQELKNRLLAKKAAR